MHMRKSRKLQVVRRGVLAASGKTKREALIDLNKQVDWAVEWHPTLVVSLFGHVIIVSPSADGYHSQVVAPDKIAEQGRLNTATCFVGRVDPYEELMRQKCNVAQLVWRLGNDDEEFIVLALLDAKHSVELRSWIKWQRLYKAHRAAGAADGEAHEKACRGESVKKEVTNEQASTVQA
jgi:hypothetical protein